MEFKKGTHVYTTDRQDVGTLDRVVLDPRTDAVSGLVIRKGWLFSEDKVVPMELVADATSDKITLRKTENDLQKLPVFEEHYYIPVAEDESGKTVYPGSYPDPLYAYPPLGTSWWGFGDFLGYPPLDLQPESAERVKQNIPEGSVALKEGAHVLSLEGEHVGDVEEVFTDAATQRATHLVISQGLLFKDRKLIPANWVKDAGEDDVMLTVNTRIIHSLPEYKAAVHS